MYLYRWCICFFVHKRKTSSSRCRTTSDSENLIFDHTLSNSRITPRWLLRNLLRYPEGFLPHETRLTWSWMQVCLCSFLAQIPSGISPLCFGDLKKRPTKKKIVFNFTGEQVSSLMCARILTIQVRYTCQPLELFLRFCVWCSTKGNSFIKTIRVYV